MARRSNDAQGAHTGARWIGFAVALTGLAVLTACSAAFETATKVPPAT